MNFLYDVASQNTATKSSSQSQSQSHVTTDDQSASLSWYKAPMWGLRADFYFCRAVADFLIWDALSEEGTDLSFARVTVSSNKPVVSMYSLHYMLFNMSVV
jgi:hypothetical protein